LGLSGRLIIAIISITNFIIIIIIIIIIITILIIIVSTIIISLAGWVRNAT
jgi:hypothetical protein